MCTVWLLRRAMALALAPSFARAVCVFYKIQNSTEIQAPLGFVTAMNKPSPRREAAPKPPLEHFTSYRIVVE